MKETTMNYYEMKYTSKCVGNLLILLSVLILFSILGYFIYLFIYYSLCERPLGLKGLQ